MTLMPFAPGGVGLVRLREAAPVATVEREPQRN